MGDKGDLSVRLYNVLEHVGASEELRKLHQDTATTVEILSTVGYPAINGIMTNVYRVGSSYEGTVTPDLASDRDILCCQSSVPVVTNVQSRPGWSLLIVRDTWTYPGHVKLQEVWDGHPQDSGHQMLLNSDLDWSGRICRQHFPLQNGHGPALKHLDKNGVHIIDYVSSLKCESIPQYALDWFLRERPYGRPSQEQLQEMGRLGCMFVCAGYVYSGEKSLEWRLSLTLQERQLMAELNPVQHKVYVLLKLIKKDILKEVFKDESLTSYHCKTCILFAVQMTPVTAWTEENLINCTLQCLKLLVKWIEENNCPNYFIKDQNMFVKEGFPRLRVRLLRGLCLIIERDINFLYMIKSDNIADLLRHGYVSRYREVTILNKNNYVRELKERNLRVIIKNNMPIIHGLSRGGQDPASLVRALDALQRTDTINGQSMEVTQTPLLIYLYPLIRLHIAKALVSRTYRSPDLADNQRLVAAADFHFSEASGLDLVNERLARATVLYKSEQYGECNLLLRKIKHDFVKQVTWVCPCTGKYTVMYNDIQDEQEHKRKIAGMPMREFKQSSTAICVTFLPSEVEIVPAPLQYEMHRSNGTVPGSRNELSDFWFDWAVVDPMIYLHFMQYLVTSKLNKEVAIDNLQAVIEENSKHVRPGRKSRLGHMETAYNLLGWIHVQEGRFAEAFVCFAESWKIRPYHNAAKFHLCCLMAKLTNMQ